MLASDPSLDRDVRLKNLLDLALDPSLEVHYSPDKTQVFIFHEDGRAWEFYALQEALDRAENFIVTEQEIFIDEGVSFPLELFYEVTGCHRHVWVTYGLQKAFCKTCNIDGVFDTASGQFHTIS